MYQGHKFYICAHCNNIASLVIATGPPLICCGEKMGVLAPNTVEASAEKHLPAVTLDGDTLTVQIGSVIHPMTEAHHISFIYVETENGGQKKRLEVNQEPMQRFAFAEDRPKAVYAYCNLHGLWMTEL
ncbi:MAG: desulfoferrodoxin [Oscillospiraceae bacterium]|nr:desulfoferrodoxin [Oscillospiraceae bacterium]